MKKLMTLIITICIGVSFTGCTKKLESQAANKKSVIQNSSIAIFDVRNTLEFTEFLDKAGYKINSTKEDKKGVLSGALTVVSMDGDILGVYEYKDSQSMEQDAKTIRNDGSMIGNTIYEFVSKPHFYKKGNIIVTYIGENKETLSRLEKFWGSSLRV